MWYEPSEIFQLKYLSTVEWLVFTAVNVAFVLFMLTVAPNLRALIRAWRRFEDEIYRRWVKYYAEVGGPQVVQRNVVPELCIGIYAYLALICRWVFVSPVLPLFWFGLALITLVMWRGGRVLAFAKALLARRRQRETSHEASDYIAQQADRTR